STSEERLAAEAQSSAESRGEGVRTTSKSAQPIRPGSGQAGMAVPEEMPHEVPGWLAERMNDPGSGEEAKEFWDGKQRAEKEAAAYREVFATPEDARALKEIYPGGVAEAKIAVERARAMDEIDAAFYRGDAGARVALAQRLMADDPAAFRAMV